MTWTDQVAATYRKLVTIRMPCGKEPVRTYETWEGSTVVVTTAVYRRQAWVKTTKKGSETAIEVRNSTSDPLLRWSEVRDVAMSWRWKRPARS